MPEEDLDKVMALLAKYPRCWVFSDEIYSQLTYDGAHITPYHARAWSTTAETTCFVLLTKMCGFLQELVLPSPPSTTPSCATAPWQLTGFRRRTA